MRKIMLGVVALAVIGTAPALAADLPAQTYTKAPVVAVAPVYNWGGFYVGLNAGGHWATDSDPAYISSDNNLGASGAQFNAIAPDSLTATGFAGGVHGGYNWQASNFVYGVELDVDGLSGSASRTAVTVTSHNNQFDDNAKDRLFSSFRARFGLAADRLLVFATGGVAVSNWAVNHSLQQLPAVPGTTIAGTDNFSTTRAGWTVGGGLEYAIGNQWSVRAEYLYSDFGTVNGTLVTAVTGAPQFVTNFAERDRLREKYRAGWLHL